MQWRIWSNHASGSEIPESEIFISTMNAIVKSHAGISAGVHVVDSPDFLDAINITDNQIAHNGCLDHISIGHAVLTSTIALQ